MASKLNGHAPSRPNIIATTASHLIIGMRLIDGRKGGQAFGSNTDSTSSMRSTTHPDAASSTDGRSDQPAGMLNQSHTKLDDLEKRCRSTAYD